MYNPSLSYTIMQPQFVVNVNEDRVQHKSYGKSVSYEILNYDPSTVQDDTRIYRSVVIDPQSKEVFSFAPPKSINIGDFAQRFPDISGDRFQMNETIEGTMVNLFYDQRIDSWEIATKGAIGGAYWYYRTSYDGAGKDQKTFRQMFLESLGCDKDTAFSNVELFKSFPRDYTYSFVMQHPDNHIVLQIREPKSYLVTVFKKVSPASLSLVPLHIVRTWSSFASVSFPNDVSARSYDILSTEDPNHIYPGYMLLDYETGLRTKLENINYVRLKELRGNNPNMLYHYLCFTEAAQCAEFLTHFPMYANMFAQFQRQVNTFIKSIHDAYVIYYVQKRGKQIRIPAHIMPHIWKLHFETHLPSVQRGEKLIITKTVVREYFNNMLPKEKWYYLNQCANINAAEELIREYEK